MDTITIYNTRFDIHVGLTASERQLPQPLFIDVKIKFDCKKAGVSDRIEDTINYANVCSKINDLLQSREYVLIENVGEEIVKMLFSSFGFSEMKLCIKKPQAILQAEYASISIVRKRSDYVFQ